MSAGRESSLKLKNQKEKLKKRITTLNKKIRRCIPSRSFDLRTVAHSEIKVGYLNKKKNRKGHYCSPFTRL